MFVDWFNFILSNQLKIKKYLPRDQDLLRRSMYCSQYASYNTQGQYPFFTNSFFCDFRSLEFYCKQTAIFTLFKKKGK